MAPAEGAELSKDILAPAEGPRENLVVTAVKFLQNPKVRQNPLSQKKAFLESKGLTGDEIQLAIQRAGVTDDPQSSSSVLLPVQQQPHHPQVYPNTALVPGQQPLLSPLPVSPWTRTREVVTTAAIVAALSYAVYNVFKTYVRPWLLGKSEAEGRLQRLETSVVELQASVAQTNTQLMETLRAIQESLATQKDSSVQSAEVSLRQETHALNEIKSEVSSLKALLLNRRQFPPPPVTSPVIPAWQKTALVSSQTQPSTAPQDTGTSPGASTGASDEKSGEPADQERQDSQPVGEQTAPSDSKPDDSPQYTLSPPGDDAASSPSNTSNGFELIKPASDSDTAADLD
ncbi:hypothetical protein ACOMHN_011724 [Nucella lapillus]